MLLEKKASNCYNEFLLTKVEMNRPTRPPLARLLEGTQAPTPEQVEAERVNTDAVVNMVLAEAAERTRRAVPLADQDHDAA